MRALFDVNVLIALLDAAHQLHAQAWTWFDANIEHGWASCPITQNGYVRIVLQPNYPNSTTVYDAISRLGAPPIMRSGQLRSVCSTTASSTRTCPRSTPVD